MSKASAVFGVWCCFLSFAALGDGNLVVERKAISDPAGNIDKELLEKCDAEQLLGRRVFEEIKRRVPEATAIDEPDSRVAGPVLQITILTLRNTQADVRILNVEAEILQNNKVARSRTIRSRTIHQPDVVLDLCGLVDRLAADVAVKVARWVPVALKVMAKKQLDVGQRDEKKAE